LDGKGMRRTPKHIKDYVKKHQEMTNKFEMWGTSRIIQK
jgi:hypothetical protein